MVKIDIDFVAAEEIRRAEFDPDAAANVLRLIARYLREGRPLAGNLRDYLANALDDAALKPRRHRAKALTDALNLSAQNRRPVDWLQIGEEFDELVGSGQTVTAAADTIAAKHEIDQATARRKWKKFLKAKQEYDAVE